MRDGLDKTYEATDHRRQFYADQLSENGASLTGHEQEQQRQLDHAQDWQAASQLVEAAASASYLIPDFIVGSAGISSPYLTAGFSGPHIGAALQAAGRILGYVASIHTHSANMASLEAGWERRARDWQLQLDTAAKELEQIDKQKAAADVREIGRENSQDY